MAATEVKIETPQRSSTTLAVATNVTTITYNDGGNRGDSRSADDDFSIFKRQNRIFLLLQLPSQGQKAVVASAVLSCINRAGVKGKATMVMRSSK